MRKVWAGNKVEKSRQKQSAGGVNVVLQAVIMDSFTSDVKKKKLKQNWRDAPVIEHARSKV